ncbi:MAG: pth, partial [Nitrospirae bacterium]|nr:pth [Nitrospirota bacterium]
MWLIAGLGNPGSRYEKTRHNVGFLAVEACIRRQPFEKTRHNVGFLAVEACIRRQPLDCKEKEDYKICKGSLGDEKIILLEPLTFMNRSGIAVRRIMQKSNISPQQLIVIHDDLDLETGSLKIRKKGSSGGHKGIESIIQHI